MEMVAKSLRTVAQLVEELPAFDEPALRRLIFHAESNGLDGSIVRIGKRVYIDLDGFNEWIEMRRGCPPGGG
jgi:hypothetical protein